MSLKISCSLGGEFAKFAEPAIEKIQTALPMVFANLPYLSGLGYSVQYLVDDRVQVAAVTESGKVLLNSDVFRKISINEAVFIIAHELMHLALDTFGRGAGSDRKLVNFAHDYVINDLLYWELHIYPPLGGLHWPFNNARELGFEHFLIQLQSGMWDNVRKPTATWNNQLVIEKSSIPKPRAFGSLGSAFDQLDADELETPEEESPDPGVNDAVPCSQHEIYEGDMIPIEKEKELFREPIEALQKSREHIRVEAAGCAAQREFASQIEAQVTGSAFGSEHWGHEQNVSALEGFYHTPWQLALQRWTDSAAPQIRSYSKASRRTSSNPEIIRPGRDYQGWTLHIVLDTSGSMTGELSLMLGAIMSFCTNSGVEQVHLLQCDTEVTVDEVIEIHELETYRIKGYGYSDMSPAMDLLAEDPEVKAVLVLTDGGIDYPEEAPPYQVLWVIPEKYACYGFEPPYGDVINVNL